MGRTSHSNYIEAARQVLGELGGTLSSRDLVSAAQERGLVGNGNWVYHNFLRKVRDSAEFDTTRRGYVTMLDGAAAVDPMIMDAPDVEAEAEVVAPDFAETPVNAEVAMGAVEVDDDPAF
jgi:hypothetical protein